MDDLGIRVKEIMRKPVDPDYLERAILDECR